jgi:hypothetical protein
MGSARAIGFVVLAATLLGCGGPNNGGLPELAGGAEMALRRGAAWSTVKVRPPYAIGPRVNLHFFKKGMVSGNIDSGASMQPDPTAAMRPFAPSNSSGALSLTINEEGIQGEGPYGGVAVDVEESPDTLNFEGTWNGARVTFNITATSLKGTIPIRRVGRVDSVGGVTSCQYVLDHVTSDGAREGTSICSGMPEQTRLEIPRQVDAWLTRKELVVVLLALLSTPPQGSLEPLP